MDHNTHDELTHTPLTSSGLSPASSLSAIAGMNGLNGEVLETNGPQTPATNKTQTPTERPKLRSRNSATKQRLTALATACATFAGLGLALVGIAKPSSALASPSIYADAIGTSWSDYSWNTTTNPASTNPVQSGATALSAQINSPWGAVSFRTSEPVTVAANTVVSFWVHGGATGASLQLFTGNDDVFSRISAIIPLNAPANTWTYFGFSAAALGNPRTIGRIGIGGWRGSTTETFSLDSVSLTNGAVPPTTTTTSTSVATTIPDAANDGTITLDPASLTPFSPRMWGSNIGAYAGPDGYADVTLRARANGKVGLIRYPGGQISQDLGWASCQLQSPVPNAVDCTQVKRNPVTNDITTTRLDFYGLVFY